MPDVRHLLAEAAGTPPDLPNLAQIRRRGNTLRTRRRIRWATGAIAAAALIVGTALSASHVVRDRLLMPAPQPSSSPTPRGVTNACPVAEPVPEHVIAYTHTYSNGTTGVRVMSPSGEVGRCVVDTPGSDGYPAWSPDGQWIAFVGGDGRQEDVYLVRADGSELARVTNTAGRKEGPVWSPDGSSLGYTVRDDAGWPSIHVSRRDGRSERVLVAGTDGVMVWLQDWSPDGQTMLFTRDDSPDGGHIALWAMSANGADQRLLHAEEGDFGSGARYSSDGQQVAFQADLEGGCIYRSGPLVQRLTRVTAGCTGGGSLSWSPDGTRIVFAGGGHGPTGAVVASADGGDQQTITTTPTVSDVDWRPTTAGGDVQGITGAGDPSPTQ